MKTLPMWHACTRCERSKSRLGVLATRWPRGVQLVVLADRARRASQAAGELDPDILRIVETVRKSLALPEDAVAGDVLVACGLGDLLDDHAAACSGRFLENAGAGARPRVIVFVDEHTATLARLAGLLDGTSFAPLGWGTATPAFMWEGAPTISVLAAHLGQPAQPLPGVVTGNVAARAPELLGVLGEHRGRRRREPGAPKWSSYRTWPLSLKAVRAHLNQEVWLAPFHPHGPWPFVVIDIDRHNALQETSFHATVRAVRKEFPAAFVVQSSASKGVHAYVRLPPGVLYEEAALIVRAYLTLKGHRFTGKKNNRLVSELTEVPEQPPRLPFGLGSHVPGSPKSLQAQLRDFISFAADKKAKSVSSFIAARKTVYSALKLRGAWSPEHREKIREWLLLEEAGGSKAVTLPPTDPWASIVDKLSAGLARIAAGGIPAYGTRTRWTMALASALTEHVEIDAAERLMLHWLRARDHVSEDVEVDPALTETLTLEIVRDAYKKTGVPFRAWNAAKKDIDTYLHARRAKHFGGRATRRPLRFPNALGPTVLYDTAFSILRMFYENNSSHLEIDAGAPRLPINFRRFGKSAGKNYASDIEKILTSGKWLKFARRAVKGVHSRIFELAPDLWPKRPFEACLHVRP